jgi:DNA-directed RNA polymerase subunit RPC12/RpoP
MVEFRYQRGVVYIFENAKAQRVKVGMTTNNVDDRLSDVNAIWTGLKATCQICGGRRLVKRDGLMPKHGDCLGGNTMPLEKDVVRAKLHLENMKSSLGELSGSEKGSVVKKIKSIERRIDFYQYYVRPAGLWEFSTSYYTECAEQVELNSHKILSEHLDELAPLGEVFRCSGPEALDAVELALSQLGLLESARKEIRDDGTSEDYGKCVICGGNLTKRASCPDCTRRFLDRW